MDKFLCVMGVLKTEKGLFIKDRISNYLNENFDILYIEQDPPGSLFEFPAIMSAIKLSIEMNEPVLYIHTKGAADPNNMWYQKPVKQMWELEFGTKKVFENYKKALVEEPRIVCPLRGPKKETWYNGFIINPSAARILKDVIKSPDKLNKKTKGVTADSRYYYECFMCLKTPIKLISTACMTPLKKGKELDNKLREITKSLPDIDY